VTGQRQLDDSQARLRELEFYCKEYQSGWTQRGSRAFGRDWMLNYQALQWRRCKRASNSRIKPVSGMVKSPPRKARWKSGASGYQRLEAIGKVDRALS